MPYEPDSFYNGYRINQAGNHTWQVCEDKDGRFKILISGLQSRQTAEKWIDACIWLDGMDKEIDAVKKNPDV
jgi:hypothetical protein